MSQIAEKQWFEVEHCCNCGMAFAMTTDFQKRRLDDKKSFYCPAGHQMHYNGPTEAHRLKQELERKQQMLDSANSRAATAEGLKNRIARAHDKLRKRIVNGVCPCCNRTFQNLMRHMKSEHPDFADHSPNTLRTLRSAFGLSQDDLAREAGTYQTDVSKFERGAPVSSRAHERLDAWMAWHGVTPNASLPDQKEREAP